MSDPSQEPPVEERLDADAAVAAIGPDRVGDDTGNDREGVDPAIGGAPCGRPPEDARGVIPRALPVDLVEAPLAPEKEMLAHVNRALENHAGGQNPLPTESKKPVLGGDHAVPGTRHPAAGADVPSPLTGFALAPVDADALQGSAWLFLPVPGEPVALENVPPGKIGIALGSRITGAILEALGLDGRVPESGELPTARTGENRQIDRFLGVPAGCDDTKPIDGVDQNSSPRVRGTTRRTPHRVAARPDPAQWRDDELVTLQEAARLFWPDGPLTTTSLRTAARDGTLEIRVIAGRHMTTPAALRRLGMPRPAGAATGPTVAEAAASMLGRLERRR